jgi:zinc transport system substrate-binding protein
MTALFLTSCTPQQPSGDIATSFTPITYTVQQICGNECTAYNIVPANAEPHDFTVTPSAARQLASAKVLFINGGGIEHWTEDLTDTNIVSLTKNMKLKTGEVDEEHATEQPTEVSLDPHVWLSPRLVKEELSVIVQELSTIYPDKKEIFEANAEKYSQELTQLDNNITQMFANCPNNEFILLHGFLAYFCDDYNCVEQGVTGLAPESDISANNLAAVVDYAKKHNIKVVVKESYDTDPVIETIAQEINATVVEFHPYERFVNQDVQPYTTIMQQNAYKLSQALCK